MTTAELLRLKGDRPNISRAPTPLCPVCEENGQLRFAKPDTTTLGALMESSPFYDSTDPAHRHTVAARFTLYQCHAGHSWSGRVPGRCSECGWLALADAVASFPEQPQARPSHLSGSPIHDFGFGKDELASRTRSRRPRAEWSYQSPAFGVSARRV